MPLEEHTSSTSNFEQGDALDRKYLPFDSNEFCSTDRKIKQGMYLHNSVGI